MRKIFVLFSLVFLIILSCTSIIGYAYINIDGRVYHTYLYIDPGKFEKIELYVSQGTVVKITAFISGGNNDIDVEIIRPDGSIELPKDRVTSTFTYSFKAKTTGIYIVLFDNSFSVLTRKVVDLAIAGFPSPITATRTITRTAVFTKTTTLSTTITEVSTTTVTLTGTPSLEKMLTNPTTIGLFALILVIGLAIGASIGRLTKK